MWLPIIGCCKQFRDIYSKTKYYHLLWAYFHELYGPVTGLKLGSDKIVIVSGHDAVKEVLSCKDFEGRPDGFFYRLRSYGKRLGRYLNTCCILIYALRSVYIVLIYVF